MKKSILQAQIAEFRAATRKYNEGPEETPEGVAAVERRYALWDRVFYRRVETIEDLAAQAQLIWDDRLKHDPSLLNCEVTERFMKRLPAILRKLAAAKRRPRRILKRRAHLAPVASLKKAA